MIEKSIYKSQASKKIIRDHYDNLMKQWPVAYQEKYVDTTYGRTYMVESGYPHNPPLILLHGSGSSSYMWIGDVEKLSQKFHVFSIDIIGEAGKSAENRPDHNTDAYAVWIKEILEALNIQSATFIGNSLGGWMALSFAITFPQMVTKVVLLATSGVAPAKKSFLFKAIPLMLLREKGLKGLNKIVYGMDDIPDEVIKTSNIIMKNFNPRMGSLPVFPDKDMKKITMPVLFIGGEKDALLPSKKTADRLKRLLPKVITKVIKNNGHVVFDVTEDILSFLKMTEQEVNHGFSSQKQ